MENQLKVNLWKQSFLEEYNQKNLTSFNYSTSLSLRMTNRQYDDIFNLLTKGRTIRFANLDLINKTLTQALNDAEIENLQMKRTLIYTADDSHLQNEKLNLLIDKYHEIYLTFGILDYFDDSKMSIKSAPLVLMPVKVECIEKDKVYQISNINHELYLNYPLIDLLISTRRIDISFPLENNFSLIEYLTYVASKVKINHFSVNNGCFLTNFNLEAYLNYRDFENHQKEIAKLPLVKSISYINSEFFNFNKPSSQRLDNHFLSMLNLDNEEYKIFKLLNTTENVIIKTNSVQNKEHLLSNIFYNYLLNNKNILITYGDDESKSQIIKILKENNLGNLFLDLDKVNINKTNLFEKIKNREKLEYDNKLLDSKIIDETTDGYYLLKNNYKKLINALRKTNEPLNLSINKAISEYYNLSDVDLIDFNIPNIESIDEIKVQEYVKSINDFVKTITNLKCNYKDHPFYGFNSLKLKQNDYQLIREKMIELSNEFTPSMRCFEDMYVSYSFPIPNNLKEMKCLLNIFSSLNEILSLNQEWFNISNYQEIIDKLNYHNKQFYFLSSLRAKIISLYDEKVFLIDVKKLETQLQSEKISKKILKSYQQYFMSKVKIDESILKHLYSELHEYYLLEDELKSINDNYPLFKEFYSEGVYNIERIEKQIRTIKKFSTNCQFLNQQGHEYSYENILSLKDTDLSNFDDKHKKCQIAFNHLYHLINSLQPYFDLALVDFTTIPLISLAAKINDASKNFSIINDYLDFYLTKQKLNRIIPNLAYELLKYDNSNAYIPMFFKRLYHDYASMIIKNNPLFNNFDNESFTLNFKNYEDFDAARLEEIMAFIKNNVKINLNNKAIPIHSNELSYLNDISESEIKILTLREILKKLKNSILINFPIILVHANQAPELLSESGYNFNLNIVISNENMLSKQVILSNYHCQQIIVFDYQYIVDSFDDKLIKHHNESYICAALNNFKHINYVSSSYNINLLSSNKTDINLKQHIIRILREKNYLVNQDVSISNGIIDIVVRMPSSSNSVAIIIDKLNYYSLESAIESFNRSNKLLEDNGFISYRIISILFFLNEKEEIEKLENFIIKSSNMVKTHKVTHLKPLTEVIFNSYPDPKQTFFKISSNQTNRKKIDILLDYLKLICPISKNELETIIGQDYYPSLYELISQKLIRVSNFFVFVNDQQICFRRALKDVTRDLTLISNEEIAEGVKVLISHQSFDIDYTIKLILKCLGYTKMNQHQYFRIENIIHDLVDSKELVFKNNILSFPIEVK